MKLFSLNLRLSFISIFFLVFSNLLFSQSIKIGGSVSDTSKNTIPYVNIVLVDQSGDNSFTLTNLDGKYQILAKTNTKYLIKFLHIGYFSDSVVIETGTDDLMVDMELKDRVNDLGDFEVVYSIPIQIKGDSIIYNLEDFTTGSERKLREALKKLPGVEILPDGKVKLNGKEVSEVLLEGRTFFNGTSKLAINNIPSNALERVEFIDNYNKDNILSDFQDSEKLVMNLTLKEDKKRIFFGDIEAGLGYEERYRVKPTTFYYHPKISINLLSDINNVGEKSLSFEDYLGLQDFSKVFTDTENFVRGALDLNDYFFNTNHLFYKERFVAPNIQLASKTMNLNAFLMSSMSNTDFESNSINSYFLENSESILESRSNIEDLRSSFHFGKINLDLNNPNRSFLNLTTTFRSINSFTSNHISTQSQGSENILSDQSDLTNLSVLQTLRYSKKFSSNFSSTLNGQISFSDRENEQLWNSDKMVFPVILEDSEQFTLLQPAKTTSKSYDVLISNYLKLSRLSHLNIDLGIGNKNRSLQSTLFQEIDNGNDESVTLNNFTNSLDDQLFYSFLKIGSRFKKNKLILTPSLSGNYYSWLSNSLGNELDRELLLLSPELKIDFDITKTQNINFRYLLSYDFPEFSRLSDGLSLLGFNSVFQGNINLEPVLRHKLSSSYSKNNLIKGTEFNLSVDYSVSQESISSSLLRTGINSVVHAVSLNDNSYQFNSEFEWAKRFKILEARFSGQYNITVSPQVVESIPFDNRTDQTSSSLQLRSLIESFPTLSLRYTLGFNRYSTFTTNTFISHLFEISMEKDLTDNLFFEISTSLTSYRSANQGLSSDYVLGDGLLRYRVKNSAWTLELHLKNFYNSQIIQENTINGIFLSDRQISIQPRIIFLNVVYGF